MRRREGDPLGGIEGRGGGGGGVQENGMHGSIRGGVYMCRNSYRHEQQPCVRA